MSKVIVVTSGKGGVGKTTTSASISAGLEFQGFSLTSQNLATRFQWGLL